MFGDDQPSATVYTGASFLMENIHSPLLYFFTFFRCFLLFVFVNSVFVYVLRFASVLALNREGAAMINYDLCDLYEQLIAPHPPQSIWLPVRRWGHRKWTMPFVICDRTVGVSWHFRAVANLVTPCYLYHVLHIRQLHWLAYIFPWSHYIGFHQLVIGHRVGTLRTG